MLTRQQLLFFTLSAFAFLCLLPLPVQAHTRQGMTHAAPHLRPVQSSKKALKPEMVQKTRRRVGKQDPKKAHALKAVAKHEPLRGGVSKRGESARAKHLVRPESALATQSPKMADAAAEQDAASIARTLYLARQPASEPVPVVSLVRSAADRPQLPDPMDVASTPQLLPSLYDKRGRLVMPAPLRGSHEILVHQNEVADRDGLARVQDDDALDEMRRHMMLVALPLGSGMQIDDRLPANRRYCRPWTANFLAELARAHYARFHTTLQVNSAVRTVAIQQHLLRTNGNAAPVAGETASPHLTGQAVDIAKRGLSLSEIAWMRGYLLPLVEQGKIDVEEEFQQSCFHISVYKKYLPVGAGADEIAVTHRDRPAALAIVLH